MGGVMLLIIYDLEGVIQKAQRVQRFHYYQDV